MKNADGMRFDENIHTLLWGSESWVLSAHHSSPSVISSGRHAGCTLDQVYPDFPLLMKVIDAKLRLSVQVHPNERTCLVTGGDPKSEMWFILSDGPIFAGLKEGTTLETLKSAIAAGKVEELLVRHDAKRGEVYYIPGGLVHAIGDGVKIYEVQQSSDTTFRLHDWDRKDENGMPRQLHTQKVLQAIDFSIPPPVPCKQLDTPYFSFRQEILDGEREYLAGEDSFLSIYAERQGEILLAPGESVRLSGENELMMITEFENV